MYKYISSLLFIVLLSSTVVAQDNTNATNDTIKYKTPYGLRIGLDISKPGISILDKSYSGLEIVGDYRISKNWYIATELGYEDETTHEDFTTSSASGSYIRLGVNYNAYENWLDMNNEIYVGFRYGFAIFDHTLNDYTINTGNGYFTGGSVPNVNQTQTGLNAHWTEIQLGIKAETFKNLFLGFSFSYKIGLSIDEQEGFETQYAPGFNRVFASNTGFGFNYTISYLIPFVNN